MTSKFKFDPLGATPSAKRNSGAYTVIWLEEDINLGVVRRLSGTREWTGIYAWRRPSPVMATKEMVANWMLEQYQDSLLA